MQRFSSDGVEIAFIDEGEGDPILLIHGFASNLGVNWRATGWIDILKRNGRRVIAFDVRGHGESAKLYDEADYGMEKMSRDARNLLDHLGLSRADVLGYSMGARIATWLALDHPGYVRSLIIGGMGLAMVEGIGGEEEIEAALRAPDIALVKDPTGRGYRRFAEATGERSECARRLHPRATTDCPGRAAGGPSDAGAHRRGRTRHDRRIAGRAGASHPRGRTPRHSQARSYAHDRRPGFQGARPGIPRSVGHNYEVGLPPSDVEWNFMYRK